MLNRRGFQKGKEVRTRSTRPGQQTVPYGVPITSGPISSILAALYRIILTSNGIDQSQFFGCIENYIRKNKAALNIREISSFRSNLIKELMRSTMSWKVFNKGLCLIGVVRYSITINYQSANGKVYTNSFGVDLAEQNDIHQEDKANE